MINLYFLSVAEAEKLTSQYCELHFPGRFEKAKKYRFKNDALLSIAAGALLYEILKIEEADLWMGAHGKLYGIKCGKHFNLSHSADYAVLAVSDCEVGVDLERIDKSRVRISESIFMKDELDWLNEEGEQGAVSLEEKFFTLWTLKESVLKATGQGLLLSPNSFSVMPLLQGESIIVRGLKLYGATIMPSFGNIELYDILNRYRISVASVRKIDAIHMKVLHK